MKPSEYFPDRVISIHALRKESDRVDVRGFHGVHISIHALRKESDAALRAPLILIVISIHALRKESDPLCAT